MLPKHLDLNHVQLDAGFDLFNQSGRVTGPFSLVRNSQKILQRAGKGLGSVS